jgi:hypothetical protein
MKFYVEVEVNANTVGEAEDQILEALHRYKVRAIAKTPNGLARMVRNRRTEASYRGAAATEE